MQVDLSFQDEGAQHELPESQVCSKGVGEHLETQDTEMQFDLPDFLICNKEVGEHVDFAEQFVQASTDLVSSEVQATEYELTLGKWKLDNVEFESAQKSDALMAVNDRLVQLIADIENNNTSDKVEQLNDHCRQFVKDVASIQLRDSALCADGECQAVVTLGEQTMQTCYQDFFQTTEV